MDAQTLASAMGNVMPLSYYQTWLPRIEQTMRIAQATTLNRAACLLGEVRQETVGLKYRTEIGSQAYLQSKPYYPYIGRGFIQVTWDYNYKAFGAWCHKRGLVADPNVFYNSPGELGKVKWAALTIAWYWSETHGWKWGTINNAADHQDWDDASHQINGGDNGIDSRRAYIKHCLSLGNAILPGEDLLAAMGFANQKELDAHIADQVNTQVAKQLKATLSAPGNPVEKMISGALQRVGRWRDARFDRAYNMLETRIRKHITLGNKPEATKTTTTTTKGA